MERITVTVESIDLEGKGVAKVDNKAIFIPGALPDEVVDIEIVKQKPNFSFAKLLKIEKASPKRTQALCPNFTICGGCSLQHIEFNAQVRYKEQGLVDNLKHIGRVAPQSILPPLPGEAWHYRYRARLSVRYVRKKEEVLVGFREKGSSFVANMSECLVLPEHISNLIPALRNMINKLTIREQIPQIEVAAGDNLSILVFRIMEKLTAEDEQILKVFIDTNSTTQNPLQLWLQPGGLDSCKPFYPLEAPMLKYTLTDFNIEMPFYPTEFTQVNPFMNQSMVKQALQLLDPKDNEVILDFFCGIGNFTLPIATKARKVIGIEGNLPLVSRAKQNAEHNKLSNKVEYVAANLFSIDSVWLQKLAKADKWLIDPPRDGAAELIHAITPELAPSRIVYISCNPATLARDAGVLINEHGYTLVATGVMNMFPHTAHVESIAVFEKQ